MSLTFQKIIVGYDFTQKSTSEHNRNHLKVWEEYKHCCIEKIQHGDDLYMIVWDVKEDKPKEVRYGSESVNSFSKFASYEDATAEILDKYDIWKAEQSKLKLKKYRVKEAEKLLFMRRVEQDAIVKHNLNIRYIRSIYNNVGYDLYLKLILYCTKIFRNHFKKELKNRVVRYLNNETKLSFREIQLIKGELYE